MDNINAKYGKDHAWNRRKPVCEPNRPILSCLNLDNGYMSLRLNEPWLDMVLHAGWSR